MQLSELTTLLSATVETACPEEQEITCGYTCDLLSWVMAKGKPGCAWVTVQTHLNVVAVASLHDMACIIHPEGIAPDPASVAKATEEGIAILRSEKTAYDICRLLADAGIASA